MKTPSIIPSQRLTIALPMPTFSKMLLHLHSPLEGRVPQGAYAMFLGSLIEAYFTNKHLDIAPFAASDPGAFIVSGTKEAIAALESTLTGKIPYG